MLKLMIEKEFETHRLHKEKHQKARGLEVFVKKKAIRIQE